MLVSPEKEAGKVQTQPVSQRELAYQRIRAAILSGELGPDVLLTEKHLATMVNLGRTPVREALQQLERDGFIRIIPFRGAIVRSITLADLVEIYEFRLGLETVAAGLASQRATDAEIMAMVELVEASQQLKDARSVVEAGQDIHRLIYTSARNARIIEALDGIQNQSQLLRRWANGPEKAFSEDAVADHRAIVAAIRLRDPQLAEERMREHILRGLKLRTALFGL